MENVYVRSAEIVRRVKLEMPVHITLNDPFNGEPITCSRGNILELLVVESHNLILEGQTVAALFAEMSRFRAAAMLAQAKAEAAFRKWKARMAHELREQSEPKTTKAGKPAAKQGPTQAEIEEHYRLHPEYDVMHDEPHRLQAIVDIFTDLRRAFDIKDNVITDQIETMRGHESVMHAAESTDRLNAYANLAEEIAQLANTPETQQSLLEFEQQLSGKSGKTRTARALD